MHSDFTLFLRKHPNGKEVYFYYAYDEEGRGPWSAKSTNKTEARNNCHKLIKKGVLIPDRRKYLTFGEFAEGFWEKGSEYVQYRDSRADIADSYLASCRSITENQVRNGVRHKIYLCMIHVNTFQHQRLTSIIAIASLFVLEYFLWMI